MIFYARARARFLLLRADWAADLMGAVSPTRTTRASTSANDRCARLLRIAHLSLALASALSARLLGRCESRAGDPDDVQNGVLFAGDLIPANDKSSKIIQSRWGIQKYTRLVLFFNCDIILTLTVKTQYLHSKSNILPMFSLINKAHGPCLLGQPGQVSRPVLAESQVYRADEESRNDLREDRSKLSLYRWWRFHPKSADPFVRADRADLIASTHNDTGGRAQKAIRGDLRSRGKRSVLPELVKILSRPVAVISL